MRRYVLDVGLYHRLKIKDRVAYLNHGKVQATRRRYRLHTLRTFESSYAIQTPRIVRSLNPSQTGSLRTITDSDSRSTGGYPVAIANSDPVLLCSAFTSTEHTIRGVWIGGMHISPLGESEFDSIRV